MTIGYKLQQLMMSEFQLQAAVSQAYMYMYIMLPCVLRCSLV